MNLLALNIKPLYLIIGSAVLAVLIVAIIIALVLLHKSSKKNKNKTESKKKDKKKKAEPVANQEEVEAVVCQSKPLLNDIELEYYRAIHAGTPQNFFLFPKVNLASIVDVSSGPQKGLHHNVAFGIFDYLYRPTVFIEIYDDSHRTPEQEARDKTIKAICDAAGIPLIVLWTIAGIDKNDIKYRIYSEIQHKRDLSLYTK